MFADIYSHSNEVDSLSVVPSGISEVFVVNNYLTKRIESHNWRKMFPVIIDETYDQLRAFPAVWDGEKYIKDTTCMFGGRLVYASNSAGYSFKHPAKLMDRKE